MPSRIRATFLGVVQPLPATRKQLIADWARQFAGAPETYTRPYQTEALFQENGAEYWLAIREKNLARIQQELQIGDQVDLYLIRVGGVRKNGKGEWVLLLEEFRKQ